MNDKAISRNDAIHLVCKADQKYMNKLIPGMSRKVFKELIDGLDNLPSVTPKYTDEEIERAQAVEQAYVDKMVELSVNDVLDKIRNEITMLHIFNRENVIEIIDKYKAESEDKE